MGIELVVSGQLSTIRRLGEGEATLVSARLAPRAPGRPAVLRLELRRAAGETAVVNLRLGRFDEESAELAPAYVAFLRDLFAPVGEEREWDPDVAPVPGPRRAAVERETLRWMASVGQQALRVAECETPFGAVSVVYHRTGEGEIGWTAVVDVSAPDTRWHRSLLRCERWLSLSATHAPRTWRFRPPVAA